MAAQTDQHLGKVSINSPVMGVVSVGQRGARHALSESQVTKFAVREETHQLGENGSALVPAPLLAVSKDGFRAVAVQIAASPIPAQLSLPERLGRRSGVVSRTVVTGDMRTRAVLQVGMKKDLGKPKGGAPDPGNNKVEQEPKENNK